MKYLFRTINLKGDEIEAGEINSRKRLETFHKCLTRFGSCTGSEPSEKGKSWFFSRCDKSAGNCGITITSVWVES